MTEGQGIEKGYWVGEMEGMKVREGGPDVDGPVLEIHGEEGMAAVVVSDVDFVSEFAAVAAEVNLALEERRDSN